MGSPVIMLSSNRYILMPLAREGKKDAILTCLIYDVKMLYIEDDKCKIKQYPESQDADLSFIYLLLLLLCHSCNGYTSTSDTHIFISVPIHSASF